MTKEMNEVKKTLSEETIIDNEVFTIEETFWEYEGERWSGCDYRLIIKPGYRDGNDPYDDYDPHNDPYEIRLGGNEFRSFLQKMYETQSTPNIVSNT
jgi:hypothetical protein